MGMRKEENTGTIVDFTGYRERRNAQVDEWLDNQVAENYRSIGKGDVKNPPLRLMTLYDMLDGEKKNKFYDYVKRMAVSIKGDRIVRDQFWAFMTAASDAWDEMEEYGKELVIADI
jgi:hypothetical protein